jgi:hypothetical protein
MTTETTTPPCPNPNLYAFTVWKTDRRTKIGWRLVEEYQKEFITPQDAAHYVQQERDRTGYRIEHRLYWVKKVGYLQPYRVFWEPWNSPYYCSPSSETYWST